MSYRTFDEPGVLLPFPDTLRDAVLDGAVVIRRVDNGWLLQVAGEHGNVVTEVYEDPSESGVSPSHSLASCLWSAFSGWMRSKRRGGLVVEVASEGWEEED